MPDFCYYKFMEKIIKEQVQFHSPSAILITDTASPKTFPAHWHNAAEFIVAVKDRCIYRINDILYELEKGQDFPNIQGFSMPLSYAIHYIRAGFT